MNSDGNSYFPPMVIPQESLCNPHSTINKMTFVVMSTPQCISDTTQSVPDNPANGSTFSRKPREQFLRIETSAARGLAAATFCWLFPRSFAILQIRYHCICELHERPTGCLALRFCDGLGKVEIAGGLLCGDGFGTASGMHHYTRTHIE